VLEANLREVPGSSPGLRHSFFLVLGGRKVGRFFLIAVVEIDDCAWRARAQMPDLMAEYISFYIQASDRAPGRRARPLYLFGAALDPRRSCEAKLLHPFLGDARRQGDERVVRALRG
jgi:hypothetical protein